MVCGASASETVDSVLIYILHTAVISAFKSPYLGNTAALEKAIDQVINDRNLYANAIPFVQSSGTGKSRLMGELAKNFFVLVLNLRENDNPGDFCKYCWKPVLEKLTLLQRSLCKPDGNVRDYLQEMEDKTDVAACWRLRYAAFLCAVFDILITILLEGVSQPSEFAKRFETPETKSSFLGQILSKSAVSLFTPAKYLSSSRFAIGIWGHFYHFIPEWSEPNVFVHHQARENLTLSLYRHRNYKYLSCWQCKEFFTKLREYYPERPPPLVLALDEAHVMTNRRGGSVQWSLFNIFASVLADLKQASAD